MAKKIKIKVDRGSKQLVHKPVGPDGQEIFRANVNRPRRPVPVRPSAPRLSCKEWLKAFKKHLSDYVHHKFSWSVLEFEASMVSFCAHNFWDVSWAASLFVWLLWYAAMRDVMDTPPPPPPNGTLAAGVNSHECDWQTKRWSKVDHFYLRDCAVGKFLRAK
jgi:hypothetical protein